MDKEFIRIKSLLHDVRETSEHGFTFVTGTSGANTVVMMQCGIGKVNAAIAKAFAEKEFEKFRVLQDRTYQSDFDRLVAETSDDLTE